VVFKSTLLYHIKVIIKVVKKIIVSYYFYLQAELALTEKLVSMGKLSYSEYFQCSESSSLSKILLSPQKSFVARFSVILTCYTYVEKTNCTNFISGTRRNYSCQLQPIVRKIQRETTLNDLSLQLRLTQRCRFQTKGTILSSKMMRKKDKSFSISKIAM